MNKSMTNVFIDRAGIISFFPTFVAPAKAVEVQVYLKDDTFHYSSDPALQLSYPPSARCVLYSLVANYNGVNLWVELRMAHTGISQLANGE